MALCGCLRGAANKVQQDFDVQKDYLGAHGYVRRLSNTRGVQLFAYFWPADEEVPVRGVVQLLHGNSTYIGFDFLRFQGNGLPNLYEGSWVQELNRQGFSVCGIDHEGCGRSQGMRSYVRSFNVHVDNAMLFARHVRQCGDAGFPAGAPHFLMGYSMGGLVSVLMALRQPGWFAGMVLLSPMISLERRARETRHLRPFLKLVSAVAPRLQVGSSTTELPVQWIREAWDADPLVYDGRMRARNAEEYFRATEMVLAGDLAPGEEGAERRAATGAEGGEAEAPADSSPAGGEGGNKEDGDGETGRGGSDKRSRAGAAAAAAAPRAAGLRVDCLSVPLLVFQGDRDTLVEPAGSETLVRRAATHEKRLRVVPGAWHVLVKEDGNEALLGEAVQWLEQQCRSSRTVGLFRCGGGVAVTAAAAAACSPSHHAWSDAGATSAKAAGLEGGKTKGAADHGDRGRGGSVDEQAEQGEGGAPGGRLIEAVATGAVTAESSTGSNDPDSALPGAINSTSAATTAAAAVAGGVAAHYTDVEGAPSPSSKSYRSARSSASSSSSSVRSRGRRSSSGGPNPSRPASGSERPSAAASGRGWPSSAGSIEGRREEEREGHHEGQEEVTGRRTYPHSGASSTTSLGRRHADNAQQRSDGGSGPEQALEGHLRHSRNGSGRAGNAASHHLPDSRTSEAGVSHHGADGGGDSDRGGRAGDAGSHRSGTGAVHRGAPPATTPEPDREDHGSTAVAGRGHPEHLEGQEEWAAGDAPEPEWAESPVPLHAPRGSHGVSNGVGHQTLSGAVDELGHSNYAYGSNGGRDSSHRAGSSRTDEAHWSRSHHAADAADAADMGGGDGARCDDSLPSGPLLRPLPPLPPLPSSGPSSGYNRYSPLPPINLGSYPG